MHRGRWSQTHEQQPQEVALQQGQQHLPFANHQYAGFESSLELQQNGAGVQVNAHLATGNLQQQQHEVLPSQLYNMPSGGVDPRHAVWMQVFDANSGRMYYFNTVTGQTSWCPPPGFLVANPTHAFVYPQHETGVVAAPDQSLLSVKDYAPSQPSAGMSSWQNHSALLGHEPTTNLGAVSGAAFSAGTFSGTSTLSTSDQTVLDADTNVDADVNTAQRPTVSTEAEENFSDRSSCDGSDNGSVEDSFEGLIDARCWGRPAHLRNVSEDGPEPMASAHARFRSLSSIDKQSLEQLAAYGRKRRPKRHPSSSSSSSSSTTQASSASETKSATAKESKGQRQRGSSFAAAHGVSDKRLYPRLRSRSLGEGDYESAITNPDATEDLLCVSAVIHAHIVQFVLASSTYISPRFAIFQDSPSSLSLPSGADIAGGGAVLAANRNADKSCMQQSAEVAGQGKAVGPSDVNAVRGRHRRRRSSLGIAIPTRNAIFAFIQNVYLRAQMEKECILMSFVYLERLLKATRGQLALNESNWKGVVLSTMILASKVWDDLSMSNGDFAKICPSFPLKRINQIEVCLLEAMAYEVRVSSSQYTKYFFQLRSMRKVLGIPIIKSQDDALPASQARRRQARRNTVFQV